MPKRGDVVPRPKARRDWCIRFDDHDAAEGWERLLVSHGNVITDAWDQLTKEPRERTGRVHQLRGDLGYRVRGGVQLEQWQYEFSGAGRIWYCIDDADRTVWLTLIQPGHPEPTATRRRRKR